MAGEEHRTHERDHLGEADGTQGQGGIGTFVLGQAVDLPSDGHGLDLDGQRTEDNRRQVEPE